MPQQQPIHSKPPLPAKPLKNFFSYSKSGNRANGPHTSVPLPIAQNTTWPISPIVPNMGGAINFNGNMGRRDCESPMVGFNQNILTPKFQRKNTNF
jgi:hypothetical protein